MVKLLKLFFLLFISGICFISIGSATASRAYASEWASTVISTNQGKQKNGQPVAPIRSDPTKALGVAEGTAADGTFYTLGFGGSMVLGFAQPFGGGAAVVESTHLPYPLESAQIDFSADGTTWVSGGTVTNVNSPTPQSVTQPKQLTCAQYIRITDTSDKSLFEDTADGFDVDGVRADGNPCTVSTPTPTITQTTKTDATPSATPTPTTTQNVNPTPTNQPSNNTSSTQPTSTPAPTSAPQSPPQACTATKPPTPSITGVNRTSGSTVNLTWSAVSPVTTYAISYGASPGKYIYGVPDTGNVTSFTVGGLDPNATYYFIVRAINNCMPGDGSGEKSTGGSVLGASTGGQVLGASTDVLAATGYQELLLQILASSVASLLSFVLIIAGYKRFFKTI